MTEQKEKIESSLEVFQKEIGQWKEEQLEKKKKYEEKTQREEKVERDDLHDPHAENINPNYLTEADRIIWEKTKNKTLTKEELSTYGRQLEDELIKIEELAKSRRTFYELVNNKAHVLFGRKELEEKKIEKEKKEK